MTRAPKSRSLKAVEKGPVEEEPYVFSDQIGHLLRRAYQKHLTIFQDHACDGQLTSMQFATLCAMRDQGPSSQTELVRATAIDQATIRPIIDKLKNRNLVELSSSARDRRKVIISLTDDGQDLLDRMIPCARDITEMTQSKLNAAERTALTYLLRKIYE